MEKIAFTFIPSSDKDSRYLPFWQIRATIPGVGLGSFADLARFANLPRTMPSQWAEQPLTFRIPAFKIQACDTTAAGDAFNGGLGAALAEGLPVTEAIRIAAAAGALAASRMGAQPSLPTRVELEDFLRQH